ncbi:translation initiation factor IF-2 [Herbinix hemicellulosilytica]|uniref:Translation initiation factor IF-2 n=1 Tax=Herbinix hemicellulosilytica TaxID=1564487 RepID=A0A0H5SVT5_HERHM|nr:translation initiation factor IF-2 [Herbinix hemicellulosilytica]RBP60766.1 translation initiation factor IF-2 [Herbinix hemicellulosilytica]CRZ34453.1 Translation initiation factor IF-2 [Herbinix hemicellulosilytica]
MAKMRVFELKNLINEETHGNIESKDILNFLEQSLGVKKTHSSNLEDHEVKAVKEHFISSVTKTSEPPADNVVRTASHKSELGQELSLAKEAQGNAAHMEVAGQRPMQTRQGIPVQPLTSGVRPNVPARPQAVSPARSQGPGARGQGIPVASQGSPAVGVRPNVPARPQTTAAAKTQQEAAVSSANVANNASVSGTSNTAGNASTSGTDNITNAAGTAGSAVSNNTTSTLAAAASTSGNTNGSAGAANNANIAGQQNKAQKTQQQKNQAQKGQAQKVQAQKDQTQKGQAQNQQQKGQAPVGASQGQPAQKQSGQTSAKASGANQSRSQQSGHAKQQAQQPKGQPGTSKNQKPYKDEQKTSVHSKADKPQGQQKGQGKDYQKYSKDENMQKGTNNIKGSSSGRTNDRKDFDQQMLDQKVAERNDFSSKKNRDRNVKDKYREKGPQFDEEDIILNKIKKGQFIKPKPVEEKKEEIKVISLPEVVTIKELAEKMKVPSSALIKKLFLEGKVVTINQEITFEEAEEIALEYDIIAEKEVKVNELEELLKDQEDDPSTLVKRPPVVCVMGHVDHGKTSLLDAIRQTNVTAKEAGGITQHIGAYTVEINGEKITFLDTPGHEAFTSMRMRGAQATDIAILVVAADDGVMPQTVEAISHAKAAGVQIIVAINKIDKPSANIERVKQELTEYNLIAEDWGGDTIMVPVSAHTKEGIDQLLEMILLTAEIEELKANPNRKARGLVIEAQLDKGRGPVATILVQKGTLRVGDNIAVGSSYGKVRAMIDENGRKVKEATPSTPVEILGLNSVPDVGEIFVVTDTEKEARHIAEVYIAQSKEKLVAETKSKITLDGLFSQIQAGNIKDLNLIIKADVQGSVEALKQSLVKLSNEEVAVRVIHGGVGAINESDVILASTSNAIIIGFNVKPDNIAKERAEQEKVEIKLYKVIYNAINDVEAAIKGLLDPVFEEQVIGHAEVRQTFKASGIGTIAGSYVLDGKITRSSKARIYRDNILVYDGSLASLKRFQDDVKEVAAGYECGLVFERYNDIRVGDQVEFYVITEVPR